MPDLTSLTIHSLLGLLDGKEASSEEVVSAYLERIGKVDPGVNSYITVNSKGAIQEAREADRKRMAGDSSPLLGVPVALKDLIATKDLRTTCGSRILENFVPTYDAFVSGKLREAGAVILGKTNMDEFAMGSSNETSYFGPVKNPWDLTRITGGSSGGSAAAVAADLCPAALGSDTGGSIRQPASLCGITGLKPTYGRVSRFGLVAFASSLDQIGPMTKDVRDSALLMDVIGGHDPMDSTSVSADSTNCLERLEKGVNGMVIGVPDEYFLDGMDADVEKAVQSSIESLEKRGARIKRISLPHTKYAIATYYVIAPAEASSNLARYDGVKYGYRNVEAKGLKSMYNNTRADGFGPEVKRRIMLGTYSLSAGYYDAYYLKALKVRTLVREDFVRAFKDVSAIVTPTTPAAAFRLGEKVDDPLKMYLSDIFTISANLAGIPGVSVPCGMTAEGLPVGLQVLGPHFSESAVLQVAKVVEEEAGFDGLKPGITANAI